MIAAAIAVMRTAPAAMSLASRTRGWKAGDAASARNSKAVLTVSAVQTIEIARIIQHQSRGEIRRRNAAATTITVAPAWIQALCWQRSIRQMPAIAWRKLRSRPVNWNGFSDMRSVISDFRPSLRFIGITLTDFFVTKKVCEHCSSLSTIRRKIAVFGQLNLIPEYEAYHETGLLWCITCHGPGLSRRSFARHHDGRRRRCARLPAR